MKKLFYIFSTLIILISTGCEKEILEEKKKIETTNKEETIEIIDDNPIKIGIYTRDSNGYHLVKNEISLPWYQYKDIITFKILPTDEENINGWYMQDIFPTYWNKYNNIDDYKIGFTLKYKTKDGDFTWHIIKPSDRMYNVFNFVQLYTYDDVTPQKGSWYDHLDDHEMTDRVRFTSIKLCASTFINEIIGPMELTVFTYNDDNDFDPQTKEYRGNSSYTIKISRTN